MSLLTRLTPLLLSLIPLAAAAQVPPTNAGRELQEAQKPLQQRPEAPALPTIQAPTPAPSPAPAGGDARVTVTHFLFSGNTVFKTEELQEHLEEFTNRPLSFGELMQVVEKIEAYYHAAGYFLTQAYLPPQQIRDGSIEIALTEGRLGQVRIEGESRVDPDVIYGYLERLPKKAPLRLPVLERQLMLATELAGATTNLDLQAGEEAGTSDVVLVLKPDATVLASASVNNHGMAATGVYRASLNLIANSPASLGDRLSANAMLSDTRDLTSYNLRYEVPLGADGWRVSAAATRAEYSLGSSFASLNGSGVANSVKLGASYPFIRSRATNLKAQVEADQAKMVDLLLGGRNDKRGHGLTFTLSADWMDTYLGTGMNRAELAAKRGQIKLGELAPPGDVAGVHGWYAKTSLTLGRQQMLSPTWSMGLQWQEQWAQKNLDSSEKFSAGGPTTLPGYANGEGSADAGSLVKINLRWQYDPALALGIFSDYAHLRLLHMPVTAASNRRHLQDNGVTADWTIMKGLSLNAILAFAGKEDAAGTDKRNRRLWVAANYAW